MQPPSKPRRPAVRSLEELRPFVRDGRYRLGPHATRHAIAEGFTERDVVMTLLHGRELARLRGLDATDLERRLDANARALFRLP